MRFREWCLYSVVRVILAIACIWPLKFEYSCEGGNCVVGIEAEDRWEVGLHELGFN